MHGRSIIINWEVAVQEQIICTCNNDKFNIIAPNNVVKNYPV